MLNGKLKGKKIDSSGVNSEFCRPTSSNVAQIFFNTINGNSCYSGLFSNSVTFVDLFAGTGRIGFDALGLGCGKVVFIEKNSSAISKIKENAKTLLLDDVCSFFQKDVYRSIDWVFENATSKESDNIIFFDPPYKEIDEFFELISKLIKAQIIFTNIPLLVGEFNYALFKKYTLGKLSLRIDKKIENSELVGLFKRLFDCELDVKLKQISSDKGLIFIQKQ